MSASKMLVFNYTDHLPGILVEEGLACGDVVDGKLDSTNDGTRLWDVVHGIDFSNFLDECRNFLTVAFGNCKTLLILLFVNFLFCCGNQNLVQLWGVVERVDGGRFIDCSKFQIIALEQSIWMPFSEFGRKDIQGHEPVVGAAVIVVFVRFSGKNIPE